MAGHNKDVKIRKEHRCFSCFRKFTIGTIMDKWTWLIDSTWNSGYTCKTCQDIHDIHRDDFDSDGIPEGYVNECLNKDETPEMYLAELIRLKDLTHAKI